MALWRHLLNLLHPVPDKLIPLARCEYHSSTDGPWELPFQSRKNPDGCIMLWGAMNGLVFTWRGLQGSLWASQLTMKECWKIILPFSYQVYVEQRNILNDLTFVKLQKLIFSWSTDWVTSHSQMIPTPNVKHRSSFNDSQRTEETECLSLWRGKLSHSCLVWDSSRSTVLGFLCWIFCFIICQMFSIGERSGLWPGAFSFWTLTIKPHVAIVV